VAHDSWANDLHRGRLAAASRSKWEKRMHRLARERGLTYTQPEGATA
jgi:hypothetical protein